MFHYYCPMCHVEMSPIRHSNGFVTFDTECHCPILRQYGGYVHLLCGSDIIWTNPINERVEK